MKSSFMKLTFLWGAILLSLFSVKTEAMEFDSYKLENGLDVIVVPDHRTPVVVNFVWYRTGAADEIDGQTGIAHMLEHMMFKGTESLPPGEFSKIIARNGGKDNAFTSQNYTAYYQKIAKDKLPLAMEMEAERMHKLSIADKDFQPERDVVLEERRWRVDSRPVSRFWEEFQYDFLPNHPYGRPVIGWKKDIENYTLKTARDWYDTWYNPSNAVLILYGDITLEEAKPLVEKTYAKVPNRTLLVKEDIAWYEPLFAQAKRFSKVDEEVKVPLFIRSYRAPSAFASLPEQNFKNFEKEALNISLMVQLLGGGDTGVLYKKLVEELKIADSADASYNPVSRGETSIDISAQPKPGVTLKEIEEAVDKTIDEFIKFAPTQDDLDRVRTRLMSSNIYAQDDPFVSAYRLGIWLMAGGTVDTFDDWLVNIKQVTPEDILKAAKGHLNLQQSSTGYLAAKKEQFGD